jgi:hypothetical protein
MDDEISANTVDEDNTSSLFCETVCAPSGGKNIKQTYKFAGGQERDCIET